MTNKIQALIDSSTVNGIGSNLYAVVMIEEDYLEDTMLWLWRADSEQHLCAQVCEGMGPNFKEDIWEILWLPKYIGQIK